MPKETEHSAIREFMERAARGEDTAGRKMKYDPKLKRFVVVDAADSSADDLPDVTPEDLASFADPHVVVHEAAARRVLQPGSTPGLTGLRALDEGDVWLVDGTPGAEVAVVDASHPDASTLADLGLADSGVQLVLRVGDAVHAQRVTDGALRPAEPVRTVPTAVDIFDRVRGVFETDVLRGRKVVIAGVGSGGSFIARELIKASVGHLVLIDHDRMEVGNVCRHECGLSDVGRLKVHAMRDLLLDRNPHATVEALPIKVAGTSLPRIEAELEGADLLVIATDNRESRLLLNRAALKAGVPSVFGAVFRRAYGGQVLRVLPGLTPCYQCFIDALPTPMEDQEISSESAAAAIAYSDRPVAIEPGLSADLLPVALLAAKLSILLLLPSETTFAALRNELVTPLYLWANRREPGTDYARWAPFENNVDSMSVLRWYGVFLPRNPQCPACGAFEDALLKRYDVEVDPADLELFGGG